eukprot:scaffold6259_cov122-Isochrysis_galbana.AAC.4
MRAPEKAWLRTPPPPRGAGNVFFRFWRVSVSGAFRHRSRSDRGAPPSSAPLAPDALPPFGSPRVLGPGHRGRPRLGASSGAASPPWDPILFPHPPSPSLARCNANASFWR